MGYLLLAVVFYTVVKYGVKVWLELLYLKHEEDNENRFAYVTEQLKKRVKLLENRATILEERL